MKVAVSSTGKNLDSAIDPRFGRCSWFLIVETEDMSFEAFSTTKASPSGEVQGFSRPSLLSLKGPRRLLPAIADPMP